MGKRTRAAALAVTAILGACGGGGGGTGSAGSGGGSGAAFGAVRLVSHSPADEAVQVAADAVIVLEFDADIALESLADEDTWLRRDGSPDNVPGSFARGGQSRVTFTPSAPLALESDYRFQLSALTCDLDGRILDVTTSFGFRTFDATPPQITNIDVVANSTNQSRTRTYQITFSEAIGRTSVTDASYFLRDSFGIRYAAARTIEGAVMTLDPYADLPGDRQFFLVATTSIADRAGNLLAAASQTAFRTQADAEAPSVVTSWPPMNRTGVSPLVQPTFTFSESMDPDSVETASLLFQDEFGSIVPFSIASNKEQRTLRVRPNVPLQPDRNYTLAFLLGAAGATDVSGNVLTATQALVFRTGTDSVAPTLATSSPMNGETRVPGTLVAELEYDEALDPDWVSEATVTLTVAGERWTSVVQLASANTIRVTPVLPLDTGTGAVLRVLGGGEGVRDLAGNLLAADSTISFTTSADTALPRVMVMPPDGASAVAAQSHVSFVFDGAMDPSTLTSSSVQVLDDSGQPLPGQLTVGAGNRVVTFVPTPAFAPLTYYRTRVFGGSEGPRRISGNWFTEDHLGRFRTGAVSDSVPPTVDVSVNAVQASRAVGLVLPPSGFSIDVKASDAANQWVDMGSVQVQLQGTGSGPGAATLFADAVIDYTTLHVVVPASAALAEGNWTLTISASDLCGNVGTSTPLQFAVATPNAALLPFERTQVVWIRTDLDRDGNGTPDFDDDMLRLGLGTAGDPLGTNDRVRSIVLDGILAQSNHLYGRGSRGEPIDAGSVALRFTKRQPIAVPHMQMALGGLDPEGDRTRHYGSESTGILGRAYFDYRNGDPSERNTTTSPGLGVFPAEMWLYQATIHQQVWPAYQTLFAQRFRPLCPDMGGTPAGSHALDAIVLAPGFDYTTAPTAQRARWQTIMDAADDWASVIGIILAHEVGHSIGLVAPGPAPGGLFGDASLHDSQAGAAEVMAPSVGYEAMTSLEYGFRDLDLAYLRQRVLLR
ncbi:MAG TPA: Ig-like domain-containing protein [Planctomycetota bacterium]|nr:Ig-like domain-containing protein [Planctomycetota bacterium]